MIKFIYLERRATSSFLWAERVPSTLSLILGILPSLWPDIEILQRFLFFLFTKLTQHSDRLREFISMNFEVLLQWVDNWYRSREGGGLLIELWPYAWLSESVGDNSVNNYVGSHLKHANFVRRHDSASRPLYSCHPLIILRLDFSFFCDILLRTLNIIEYPIVI